MNSREQLSIAINTALRNRENFIKVEGTQYFIHQDARQPNFLSLHARDENLRPYYPNQFYQLIRINNEEWREFREYLEEINKTVSSAQNHSPNTRTSSSSSSSSSSSTTTTTSFSSAATAYDLDQASSLESSFDEGESQSEDSEMSSESENQTHFVSVKLEKNAEKKEEKKETKKRNRADLVKNKADLKKHKDNLVLFIQQDEEKALALLDQYWIVKGQYWHEIDIDELYDARNTYLMLAVTCGRFAVAKKLIEYCGANVNKRYNNLEGALEKAIQCERLDMVELLIQHGVDVTRKMGNGHSPISLAVSKGNLAILQLLVQAGASVRGNFKKAGKNHSEMSLAKLANNSLSPGEKLNAIQTYLNEQSEIQKNLSGPIEFDQSGELAGLIDAIETKDESVALAIVRRLVSPELWLNHIHNPRERKTLALLAVENGLFDLLLLLGEKGADLHVKDEQHQTILHYAVLAKHIPMLQFLLEKGVSPFSKNKGKFMTPLHIALNEKQWKIAEILIQAAPQVLFWGNRSKKTPMDYILESKSHNDVAFKTFKQNVLMILEKQGSKYKAISDFFSSKIHQEYQAKEIKRGKKRKFGSEDRSLVSSVIDLEEGAQKKVKKLVSVTEYHEAQLVEWIQILCGNKKPTDPQVNCFRYAPAMMFALENRKAPTQEVDLSFVGVSEWFLQRNHSLVKDEELGFFSYSWGGYLRLSNYLYPSLTQLVIPQEPCAYTQRSIIKADPVRVQNRVLDARIPSIHFAKLNDTLKQEALSNPEQAGFGMVLFDRLEEFHYQLRPLLAGDSQLKPKTIELLSEGDSFEFRLLNEQGEEIRHRHLWSEFTEYPKEMPKRLDIILSSRDADFLYCFGRFLKRKNYISDSINKMNAGHAISFLVSKNTVYYFDLQGYQRLSDEERKDPKFISNYIYKETLPPSLYIFWDQVLNSPFKASFDRGNIYQNDVCYIFRQPKYEFVHLKSEAVADSFQMEMEECPTDTSYTSHRVANNFSTETSTTTSATVAVSASTTTTTTTTPDGIHVNDLFSERNQGTTTVQAQIQDSEKDNVTDNTGNTHSSNALQVTEENAFDFDFLKGAWENFDLGFWGPNSVSKQKASRPTPSSVNSSGAATGLNLFSFKTASPIQEISEIQDSTTALVNKKNG